MQSSHPEPEHAVEPLASLVGRELSSVEFVRDYVQLRFDGPYLTAVTHPSVDVAGTRYTWGRPGFRDALCERIGQVVARASVTEHEQVRLEFGDGAAVVISLEDKDYCGPEAVLYFADEGWWVW
jgi:hypothetical protein